MAKPKKEHFDGDPIWFRPTPALRQAIEELAEEDRRTVTEIVRNAMTDLCIAKGKLPGRPLAKKSA